MTSGLTGTMDNNLTDYVLPPMQTSPTNPAPFQQPMPTQRLENIYKEFDDEIGNYSKEKIDQQVEDASAPPPKLGWMAQHPIKTGMIGAGLGLALGVLTKSDPEEILGAMLMSGGIGAINAYTGRDKWKEENNKYNAELIKNKLKAEKDALDKIKLLGEVYEKASTISGKRNYSSIIRSQFESMGVPKAQIDNLLIDPNTGKDKILDDESYKNLQSVVERTALSHAMPSLQQSNLNLANRGIGMGASMTQSQSGDVSGLIKGISSFFPQATIPDISFVPTTSMTTMAGQGLNAYSSGVNAGRSIVKDRASMNIDQAKLRETQKRTDLMAAKTSSDLKTDELKRKSLKYTIDEKNIKLIKEKAESRYGQDPKTGKIVITPEAEQYQKALSYTIGALSGVINKKTGKPFTKEEQNKIVQNMISIYGKDGYDDIKDVYKQTLSGKDLDLIEEEAYRKKKGQERAINGDVSTTDSGDF